MNKFYFMIESENYSHGSGKVVMGGRTMFLPIYIHEYTEPVEFTIS